MQFIEHRSLRKKLSVYTNVAMLTTEALRGFRDLWRARGTYYDCTQYLAGYGFRLPPTLTATDDGKIEGMRSIMSIATSVLMEEAWCTLGRPYYDVWPTMIDAVTKCKLQDTKVSDLQLPITHLYVRFPKGLGTNILASLTPTGLEVYVDDSVDPLAGFAFLAKPHEKLHDIVTDPNIMHVKPMVGMALSTVAALALLSQNKDIIEPIVLNKDIHKYEKTHDVELIEKAKRKGLFGFNVGRHVEVAPGFRKPHFGIRWKGVGRTRRELVPIKGCLVKRKLITEVPTGYFDKDGADTVVTEQE